MSAHASDCSVCRKDLMACTCPSPPAAPEPCSVCGRLTGGCCTVMIRTSLGEPTAPELPEGWALEFCKQVGDGAHYLEPAHVAKLLRALLATQGLSIMDAKDRALLDGVVRLVAEWIEQGTVDQEDPDVSMQQIESLLGDRVQAELARREVKS